MALLEVTDLSVRFARKGQREVTAVDGVSFSIDAGEVVGLVGESGCGKSVTSLAIMGLLPKRGVQVGGRAEFDGMNLLELKQDTLRDIRGRDVAMIFQDPLSSLNPVIPIGVQVTEVLERHRGMKGEFARKEAARLLDRVGIPDPRRRLKEYPHQLSGGMRQRAMIAMALSCNPSLLIADEPTTALDVTIQAQILELMMALQAEFKMAILMITHNLGVIAEMADRVAVMYMGKVVELTDVTTIFEEPLHPYTIGLMRSIPRVGGKVNARLATIPGSVPDPFSIPTGCAFAPRCPAPKRPACYEDVPLREVKPGHWVRCTLY